VAKIIAQGMLVRGTPVEDHRSKYQLLVKREDKSCTPPGPYFSKTRGVYAHVKKLDALIPVGVLDTYHSQAGHAVARACKILGRRCINFYPEYKYEPGPRPPQLQAKALGAELVGLPAGRSAILFHQARKICEGEGGYMMPNALKLEESVIETAKEVTRDLAKVRRVIIPASSATLAAGVIKGFLKLGRTPPMFIIHLGYTRSHDQVDRYIRQKTNLPAKYPLTIIDEGYAYKDKAVSGPSPPWPCNPYYDLKAFRWWMREHNNFKKYLTLFWNIG